MVYLLLFVMLLLSAIAVLLLGCIGLSNYPSDELRILFLDVGYGDAMIIQKGARSVLIDGGYPVYTKQLLIALEKMKIAHLDAAILTHPHPDHIGGLYGVLSSGFPVDKVFGVYPLKSPHNPSGFKSFIKTREKNYVQCQRGDVLKFDRDFEFHVLHPDKVTDNLNDSSMVLKLSDPHGNILLGADIGPSVQRELASLFGKALRSRILKCPYHGGPADHSFVSVVNPDKVVVQVGINPYSNPVSETIKKYRQAGAVVMRTDYEGSLLMQIDRDGRLIVRSLNIQ